MKPTPRHQRHTEMKAAILAVARTVILEAGSEHFSLREVARRSGYSPAGLYEYFSGKEDLVQAVANESLAQLYAALSYAACDLPRTTVVMAAAGSIGPLHDLARPVR